MVSTKVQVSKLFKWNNSIQLGNFAYSPSILNPFNILEVFNKKRKINTELDNLYEIFLHQTFSICLILITSKEKKKPHKRKIIRTI